MSKAMQRAEDGQRGGDKQPPPAQMTLPHKAKILVVTRLAQFASAVSIIAEVQEVFGVTMHRQHVYYYDPDRPYAGCGKKHRLLHAEVRQRYLNDISDVGIAHQSHRLRTLQRLADKAEDREQWGAVQGLLKQAAEEMGGSFTNQRTVTHKGTMGMVHLNGEDAKAELAQRLGTVLADLALPAPQVVEEDTNRG